MIIINKCDVATLFNSCTFLVELNFSDGFHKTEYTSGIFQSVLLKRGVPQDVTRVIWAKPG